MQKIILTQNEKEISIQFDPELNEANVGDYISTLLNTFPDAFLNVLSRTPLLRPACDEEKEAHVYVFQDGEKGEAENRVFKARGNLYDTLNAIFSTLLTAAFPDVEYIKGCKIYQQEYCTTHTPEEAQAFLSNAENVTKYVRDNYNEILEKILAEEKVLEDE